MGYYPKHLKVRRQRWNMYVIATAALSGAVIVPYLRARPGFKEGDYNLWSVHYPDGQQSKYFPSRGQAAATYLIWFFDKNDIWPRRRPLICPTGRVAKRKRRFTPTGRLIRDPDPYMGLPR